MQIRGNNLMATMKTDTDVLIDGKLFTISGYESPDYIQKIASYINGKIKEFNSVEGYRRQNSDLKNVLMQINIADDYFKAKKQIAMLEEDLAAKEKELYDLKHELIAGQIKLENTEKSLKDAQVSINDREKKIVRLETELKK
jgi:cell division protein ZapA